MIRIRKILMSPRLWVVVYLTGIGLTFTKNAAIAIPFTSVAAALFIIYAVLTVKEKNGRHRAYSQTYRPGATGGTPSAAFYGTLKERGIALSRTGKSSGIAAFTGVEGDFPLGIGEVFGIRGWRVTEDYYRTKNISLRPIYKTQYMKWRSSQNVATCDLHKSQVPKEDCGCGFYAYFWASHVDVTGDVIGVVAGYGRTLLGARGFRAEKARIVAFVKPPNHSLPAALSHSFPSIPQFSSIMEMMKKFPLTPPPED